MATLVRLHLFYSNQNSKHISMEIDKQSWCWISEKALLYFPSSDSRHSSLWTVSWWVRALWLACKCAVFLLWLNSTSGCNTSEHLSCAHPGFPSFSLKLNAFFPSHLHSKIWVLVSFVLTQVQPRYHGTLLLFWTHNIRDFKTLLWWFLSYRLHSSPTAPLQRKVNYDAALAISFCFRRVWTKSWYFPQHPFTRGQSKRSHVFATKVVSAYQCFQHRCISANGTTSAVSCVTVASDWKPLNYYTLDRGTKEDVELFKASAFVCLMGMLQLAEVEVLIIYFSTVKWINLATDKTSSEELRKQIDLLWRSNKRSLKI